MSEDFEPVRPKIFTSEIKVTSYYNKMDTRDAVSELQRGNFVLIEDFYFNGLQILELLKKKLKTNYSSQSFKDQRIFRSKYRKASHNLLVTVIDSKLQVKKAPKIGWLEKLYPDVKDYFISFPDVQGLNSSWQWYLKGLHVKSLNIRIHPYYGVYFPTRFDHLELFDEWLKSYAGTRNQAIDVGIGSGILSFLLIKHGFQKILGTDNSKNAIIGMDMERERLGYNEVLDLEYGDLFANCGIEADLIVFNPPWIQTEEKLQYGLDNAIYYQPSLFPRFFKAAKKHLSLNGKLVILFSNIQNLVGITQAHPIREELKNNNRLKKLHFQSKPVKSGSRKTRRKNWRNKEIVELWVLTH